MHRICPATGHVISEGPHERQAPAAFCPHHGVKLFVNCRACKKEWTLVSETPYSSQPTGGSKFCRHCGAPAPWLTRADLMQWVGHQVQESPDLTSAARVELVAVLDRLKDMDPSDEKAIPAWKRLHELAPKVYNATKPVRDALMAEGVKKALEGLFGTG